MVYMQNKPLEEGEVALTEQQICEVVLGIAYGYIRGRGHGPKPNRRASSSTSSDAAHHMEEELSNTKELVAAQQTQLETQQNQLETQQTQIVSQQARIDWLQSVVTKLAGVSPPMDDLVAPRTSSTTASTYVESVAGPVPAPACGRDSASGWNLFRNNMNLGETVRWI